MKTITYTLALVTGMIATANAAIVSVDNVTTSSTASNGTSVTHIIDGSGLSATLTEANKYTITHNQGFNASEEYLSDYVDGETFIFSFNSSQTIGEILIWNYSQSDVRGLDAISGVEIDTGSGFMDLLINAPLQTADAAGYKAQSISLGSIYNNVDAIRLTVAQSDTGGGQTAGGFDEVAFSTVPEPSSAALLGLGGLALILRRRK
jgi:hypothetical protein